MKRRYKHRSSFIHKYHHVYIFITILVVSGFVMGCIGSRFIEASDIESLSSLLTTVGEDVEAYRFFINQFFLGIVLIVIVFLFGTSLAGIPIIAPEAIERLTWWELTCRLLRRLCMTMPEE